MRKETKIALIVGAIKALDYQKKKPNAEIEEIIQKIMKDIQEKEKNKMGAVTGAAKAFELKQKNPSMSDKEIMNQIMKESDLILRYLD